VTLSLWTSAHCLGRTRVTRLSVAGPPHHGPLLPGNINPRETHIERSDLEAWRRSGGAG